MSGITAVLCDDTDWAVLGEIQTLGHGANVTKLWLCNFGSAAKTFTISLPSVSPFTRNVAAGARGYVYGAGVDFTAPNLKYRFFSPSDPYWDMRLFDGNDPVTSACFSAS